MKVSHLGRDGPTPEGTPSDPEPAFDVNVHAGPRVFAPEAL
jgi:hypothetical protein